MASENRLEREVDRLIDRNTQLKKELEQEKEEKVRATLDLQAVKDRFSELKSALEEQLESKESEDNDLDQLKAAITELHGLNEYIQDANTQLQTEVSKLRLQLKEVPLYQAKIKTFEGLLEDLSAENTRLLIENAGLKRTVNSTSEKEYLVKLLEEYKAVNRQLLNEGEDLRHRLEVSEKLRLDAKEQLQRYITRNLDGAASEKAGGQGYRLL